jgi:hypothetical protein
MVILLMFQNNPERSQEAFVLQGVSDEVLVTNGQVFHSIPPPCHYGGGRILRLQHEVLSHVLGVV